MYNMYIKLYYMCMYMYMYYMCQDSVQISGVPNSEGPEQSESGDFPCKWIGLRSQLLS